MGQGTEQKQQCEVMHVLYCSLSRYFIKFMYCPAPCVFCSFVVQRPAIFVVGLQFAPPVYRQHVSPPKQTGSPRQRESRDRSAWKRILRDRQADHEEQVDHEEPADLAVYPSTLVVC